MRLLSVSKRLPLNVRHFSKTVYKVQRHTNKFSSVEANFFTAGNKSAEMLKRVISDLPVLGVDPLALVSLILCI